MESLTIYHVYDELTSRFFQSLVSAVAFCRQEDGDRPLEKVGDDFWYVGHWALQKVEVKP